MQILTGLKDIHAEGIVHTDVKPTNVMFFQESVTWKLVDLDGARKMGESRAACFTVPYAAPEVLREWRDEMQLPVARPASDLWSFGILAFEVVTGERPCCMDRLQSMMVKSGARMFEDEFTEDEISEFVLDGKVEERLKLIVDECHREAVSIFLKFDPAERWSASDALQHTMFHSDPHTTTT